MQVIELFYILTYRPEALANRLRIVLITSRSEATGRKKRTASSAYMKDLRNMSVQAQV
jgi:hypothetical protein